MKDIDVHANSNEPRASEELTPRHVRDEGGAFDALVVGTLPWKLHPIQAMRRFEADLQCLRAEDELDGAARDIRKQ